MPWYAYIAYVGGGAFLANAVPHLRAGLARRAFPTPFASPPFRGFSPPGVNTAWALVNLAVAYVLLSRIPPSEPLPWLAITSAAAGFVAMSLQVARSTRRLRNTPPST